MLHNLPRRIGYWLACFAAVLPWPYPAAAVSAEPLLVSVVLSENGGAYSDFSAALRENLLGSNVTFSVQDTSQAPPNSGLVIAVGMKAASIAANSNAPVILNVMIPKAGHKKLLRDVPRRENSSQFSTIYLDQPIERQLSLIAASFPDRNRIGVMFDSPPPDELEQLRQKVSEYGLSLYEQEIASNKPLFEALQNVLQHSNVLLALPDPTVYNSSTLRNILVSTYQAGAPLVGFSASYVRAGAMCAVFSTPAQIASQSGLAIRKFAETGTLPLPQYPKYFEIAVNDRVAQALQIDIQSPEELARRMSGMRKRMP